MTRQIRKAFFETNSSSSHSVVLDGNEDEILKPDLTLHRTAASTVDIILSGGEFGWEIEQYNDAYTKASYLLTWAKAKEYDLDEQPGRYTQMLKDVIEEETGGKLVIEPSQDKCYPYGYIDHQSYKVAEEIFESKEKIHKFIFDQTSVLHTDNDDH